MSRMSLIEEHYSNRATFLESEILLIQSEIDLLNGEFSKETAGYYNAITSMYKEQAAMAQSTTQELRDSLQEALDDGRITAYTDNWYEWVAAIQQSEQELLDTKKELKEISDLIKDAMD